jgi:biopolymer transport protein ExbD
MGMDVTSGHKQKADMNVVPLIDIVLVLLIIFMVMTPMMQRGYDMNIPEKSTDTTVVAKTEQMVVEMTEDGRILINKQPITEDQLKAKLEELLTGRKDKIVFFDGNENLFYQEVVAVMDTIRAAGGTVGLVTTELAAAP